MLMFGAPRTRHHGHVFDGSSQSGILWSEYMAIREIATSAEQATATNTTPRRARTNARTVAKAAALGESGDFLASIGCCL